MTETVRIWRAAAEPRALLMAGRTTSYALDPRGEYVFGTVAGATMRARRGADRHTAGPGSVVAWDPFGAHSGSGEQPWGSRLIVVGSTDLTELTGTPTIPIAQPVLRDARLFDDFVALHRALEDPRTPRLESDARLAAWLTTVLGRSATHKWPRETPPADARALHRALELIGDEPTRNIGLDDLARAAGVDKFRLTAAFTKTTGLPPHAFQLSRRLGLARRRLERGEPIAEVAAATGFSDQSHLHRHFKRATGMTPRAYQRRTAKNVQDADIVAA